MESSALLEGKTINNDDPVPVKKSRVCLFFSIFSGLALAALLLITLLLFGHRQSYPWELRHVSIPLSNNQTIAASLAFPLSPNSKFPIVAELLPYRKDDMFYPWRYPMWSFFARNGVVFAALDCPGTGSSPGATIEKEYSDRELQVAQEAIAWLSSQPWSLGKVGLVGKSWSAFNALMLAAMETPNLGGEEKLNFACVSF